MICQSLARNLKVEGCSQARSRIPSGRRSGRRYRLVREGAKAYVRTFMLFSIHRAYAKNLTYSCFQAMKNFKKKNCAKFSTRVFCSASQRTEGDIRHSRGTSVSDPNPRQSSLDVTNEPAKLWLGLKENEDDYAELIGDALQDLLWCQGTGQIY